MAQLAWPGTQKKGHRHFHSNCQLGKQSQPHPKSHPPKPRNTGPLASDGAERADPAGSMVEERVEAEAPSRRRAIARQSRAESGPEAALWPHADGGDPPCLPCPAAGELRHTQARPTESRRHAKPDSEADGRREGQTDFQGLEVPQRALALGSSAPKRSAVGSTPTVGSRAQLSTTEHSRTEQSTTQQSTPQHSTAQHSSVCSR